MTTKAVTVIVQGAGFQPGVSNDTDCVRGNFQPLFADSRKLLKEKHPPGCFFDTFYKNIKKKILPQYFRDVSMGIKTFELRKDEDDVQPGDILDLLEWDNGYTGRNIRCAVTYVLRHSSRIWSYGRLLHYRN